ncbi:hypothetical protein LCGC14_1338400 [marine sediment metagenome]|uniref:Uncharacterized protein n=1 Tax=marine sediment metagenome TaxID=412755 RepID=A0A0F9MVB7_9ZZZZ
MTINDLGMIFLLILVLTIVFLIPNTCINNLKFEKIWNPKIPSTLRFTDNKFPNYVYMTKLFRVVTFLNS